MLRLLRRWLGGRPAPTQLPDEGNGVDVLEFLRVPPLIVSWARGQRRALEGLWAACPRADWLLAIAGRAGVTLDRLVKAAQSLELPLAGSVWASGDQLVADLGSALDLEQETLGAAAIDPARLRELEAMANEARAPLSSFHDRASVAARAADEAHRAFHTRRADLVREAIPYREIRALLYSDAATTPYR
jgi:hypothetical protein